MPVCFLFWILFLLQLKPTFQLPATLLGSEANTILRFFRECWENLFSNLKDQKKITTLFQPTLIRNRNRSTHKQ